jgi:hypothetical protein
MALRERMLVAVLGAWLLVTFAHSATSIGYDGQWYGLRGDRVLVGADSVFDTQGLVAPVNYFPKLYELFLVPLSGLGSSTVVVGMSILILGLCAAASVELLQLLGLRAALPRLLGALLVVTLPAAANIALEAKPDLLATLLLLVAWSHAARLVAQRNAASLLWLLGLVMLSTQAKLTAIPFATALLFATLAACVQRPAAHSATPAETRLARCFFVLAAIACAFATARTLLLAGVPTIGPDPLLALWRAMGFDLRFPVGTLRWNFPTDWADIPALARDLLFAPHDFRVIAITWVGNVWLWLALVALAFGPLGRRVLYRATQAQSATPDKLPLARASFRTGSGLMLAAFIVMACWGFQYRGGDGNYFISGLIPAILLGIAAVWRRVDIGTRPAVAVALCGFCLFQAAYGFASAWWTGGTRAFDLDFARNPRTFAIATEKWFRDAGIGRIARYLDVAGHNPRVVGCTVDDDTLGMRLPASFESIAHISYARPDFTDTREHFVDFLRKDSIAYLVLPRDDGPHTRCIAGEALLELAARWRASGIAPAVVDDGYLLYDVAAILRVRTAHAKSPDCSLDVACVRATAAAQE